MEEGLYDFVHGTDKSEEKKLSFLKLKSAIAPNFCWGHHQVLAPVDGLI